MPKGSTTWNASESAAFCSQRGKIPPNANSALQNISWVSILWPYIKNKDIIWCPSDPNRDTDMASHNDPAYMSGMVSYIYKPAVDRAWFNTPLPKDPDKPNGPLKAMNFRKDEDFAFVADQMVFFEHTGWHWGDQNKGWSSSDKGAVTLNAAFLDGHVRAVRLKHAIGCSTPRNCSELAGTMSFAGEPIWYNTQYHSDNSTTTGVYKWFDPRVCYDDLP
jgi:prepilin-type processing-associated H-X9-DG protein